MEISKWAFTQTVREVLCPRCNVAPQEPCRMPSGRLTRTPHVERVTRYREKIGDEEFLRRHGFTPSRPAFLDYLEGKV